MCPRVRPKYSKPRNAKAHQPQTCMNDAFSCWGWPFQIFKPLGGSRPRTASSGVIRFRMPSLHLPLPNFCGDTQQVFGFCADFCERSPKNPMFSIYNPFLSFFFVNVHMAMLLWRSDTQSQVLAIVPRVLFFIAYTPEFILGVPVITVSSPTSKLVGDVSSLSSHP